MSQTVNIDNNKLYEGIVYGSIYLQCPCCSQGYDHSTNVDALMEMVKTGEDLYIICEECGNSFYLCLMDD